MKEDLTPAYAMMYNDLLCNRLEVTLAPSRIDTCAKDGGMIRAVEGTNPAWYQEICRRYPRLPLRKAKKVRTILKRREFLRLLRRLKEGEGIRSRYQEDLEDIAREISRDLKLTPEEVAFYEHFGELPTSFKEQF